MSRGYDFDSFGMDDFRESDSDDRGRETSAGRAGGSLSNTSVRLQLQRLREKEMASDRRASPAEIIALPLQTIVICRFDLTVGGPSIATATECIPSGHRRSTRSPM